MNEENTKQSSLAQNVLNLIDAIERVQDWRGTYVGDCIKDVLISGDCIKDVLISGDCIKDV